MGEGWIDTHSITCAVCGELHDERDTIPVDPGRLWEADPEAYKLIGRAYVAREIFGEGEALPGCLTEHLIENIGRTKE